MLHAQCYTKHWKCWCGHFWKAPSLGTFPSDFSNMGWPHVFALENRIDVISDERDNCTQLEGLWKTWFLFLVSSQGELFLHDAGNSHQSPMPQFFLYNKRTSFVKHFTGSLLIENHSVKILHHYLKLKISLPLQWRLSHEHRGHDFSPWRTSGKMLPLFLVQAELGF